MTPSSETVDHQTRDALAEHRGRAEAHSTRAQGLERRILRVSTGRLATFVGAFVLLVAAFEGSSVPLLLGGGASGVAFVALVALHARLHARLRDAEIRRDVHLRHVTRIEGRFTELPVTGVSHVPEGHPYARDIDLVGPGSLVQRIDVTHTVDGEASLVRWLSASADPETIARRQAAVRELAPDVALREELEASALVASGSEKLDPRPFLAFTRRAPTVPGWALVPLHLAPVVVVVLGIASRLGHVPKIAWGVALLAQATVALASTRTTHPAFELVSARRGYAEAFQRMLAVLERSTPRAPLLVALRDRVMLGGQGPSRYMARLDRWAGLAELRTQFPLHFVVNVFTLWDLHVLYRLERWNREVGEGLADAIAALGELEALASLAGLLHSDPGATLPEVRPEGTPFEAVGLAHPLLPPSSRVANDVHLGGPGTALVVTGSNMAGKSTLLRAVGLDVALALAGGPVVARSLTLSRVDLRASMRVDDDLQRGASYFHAELTKLRTVVRDPEPGAPLFFLLDELLRGTNARARHLGARAILTHLLARGGTGLAATHDVALAELEAETSGRVRNVHFTDVLVDGEMVFDYHLRDGVVKTSNALRLLKLAGVDVPEDEGVTNPGDRLRVESPDH